MVCAWDICNAADYTVENQLAHPATLNSFSIAAAVPGRAYEQFLNLGRVTELVPGVRIYSVIASIAELVRKPDSPAGSCGFRERTEC